MKRILMMALLALSPLAAATADACSNASCNYTSRPGSGVTCNVSFYSWDDCTYDVFVTCSDGYSGESTGTGFNGQMPSGCNDHAEIGN